VTLCFVTDRRRFGWSPADLVSAARDAAQAGIDLIQVRERDLEARDLAAIVTRVLEASAGTPARVVVNDRLDVALTCGAQGVHLRADSIPIADARALAPPPFLVGRSVHSVDEARKAGGADYVIAGTVFATGSKPGAALLGLDGLAAIVVATPLPVLAIGGIGLDEIPAVSRTGAAGVAAIALFGGASQMRIRAIVDGARRRFDSVKTGP